LRVVKSQKGEGVIAMQRVTDFMTMELGATQPTSVPMEIIEVKVSVGGLVSNFAKAFVSEAMRRAPLKAPQVNLTADELTVYCEYLLTKRIEVVNNECRDFSKLRILAIPVFIQHCLSMVGRVIKREFGITLHPVMESPCNLSFEEAVLTSNKIRAFEDELHVVIDALPRKVEGDEDVMSTALIAGYVRAIRKVDHIASTYVSAFMNFQLQKEAAFSALYRIQYDDIEYITQALLYNRSIL